MTITLKKYAHKAWAIPICFLISYVFASLLSANKVVYFEFGSRNHVFYIAFSVLMLASLALAYALAFTPLKKKITFFFCVFPSNSANCIRTVIMSGAVAVLFGQLAYNGPETDYSAHINFAETFDWSHPFESISALSNPLWHIVTNLFIKVFYVAPNAACALSTAMFCLGTYIATRGILRYCVNDTKQEATCDTVALLLMFMQPLYIPWFNPQPIIGQGSPFMLHNPTSLAVQPFALVSMFLLLRILKQHSEEPENKDKSDFYRLAFFLFVSTMAKPSFSQIFIPATAIYLLIYLILTKFKELRFCVNLGICAIPAILNTLFILIVEFISSDTNNGNTIIFGWFNVWRAMSPCIPVSILLAAGFCLLYIALKNVRINNKTAIYMVLLCWVVGILEFAILMESGDRMGHGNFSWGYCNSLSLMYVFVTAELLTNISSDRSDSRKLRVPELFTLFVFAIQFVQGLTYFLSLV